ncbi:MAG TPA: hypothetical protein PLB21_01625 [Actinomycetota bacterium]|nr:hypothetical protein [Actinomycetota bacterium]
MKSRSPSSPTRNVGRAIVGLLAVALVLASCGTVTNSVRSPAPTSPPAAAILTATKVVGGEAHTCAILSSKALKCWGANGNGQLGQGDTKARGDQPGEMGAALPPIDLGKGRTVLDVAAGGAHTCAVLDNGAVKCWGLNRTGQLGLGDATQRGSAAGQMGDNLPAVNLGAGMTAVAITAGKQHTCAVLKSGAVKCWGYNARGELGLGTTTTMGINASQMGDNLPAVKLGNGRSATTISAGWYFNCAVLDNRSVKCWGFNNYGQLGVGTTVNQGTQPSQMGDNLKAVPLGTDAKGMPAEAEDVSAGGGHVCAQIDQPADRKRDNNTVKCWGDNEQGQLGQGDTRNRGDQPNELGDALPAIALGTATTTEVNDVVAGGFQTCALLGIGGKKKEAVKCFGGNDQGQLGLGNTTNRGDAAGEMGDALPAVSLDKVKDILAIGAGGWQSCAILDSTRGLKCWGKNETGQLGIGNTVNRGDKPGQMGSALPAVDLG